jgi:hypothetical protein
VSRTARSSASALDLTESDAAQRLFDLTADLDVGLYISNAELRRQVSRAPTRA